MLSNDGLCLRAAAEYMLLNNSDPFQTYGVTCSYFNCPFLCTLVLLRASVLKYFIIFPRTASPAKVLKYTERCCVDCSETRAAVLAVKLGLSGRSPLLEVICPTGRTPPLKMLLEFSIGLTGVVLAVVTQPMLPVAIKLHVYCMNSQ